MGLFCFLTFFLVCNLANAFSESIQVPAGETETRAVNMKEGDRISGRVTIVGQSLNFSIYSPDGQTIINSTLSDPIDFQFVATATGVYGFYFENTFSNEANLVTLNYNVQYYIFGFPQEYIILFFIVGLALVAVVVYAAMSPKP
ncbi:MAG: emp24/gp25L/p24 family protein [Candidatus Bathyarchaeota archaeon]|nr:MAG: emp24/gp25L/p24 family protein [Candidatus Bathyarchaeota archaeon]